jgi:tRNA(Ile)-lysidine synthase
MPAVREWNQGWHARPLLEMQRRAIRAWAVANKLHWIEDPSNAASIADRNYLRHRVLPGLLARWPSAAESIARSAAHCADAADPIRCQAADDLHLAQSDDRILISVLKELPVVRARNVLRYWLRERTAPPLSLRRLDDAYDQLCNARSDAMVKISWHGFEMRRYRGQVWLLRGQPELLETPAVDWSGEEMRLGPGLGRVRRSLLPGGVDRRVWDKGKVQIAYRHVGLRCRPAGRRGTRSFKKIAQEYGIPPWQRDIVPVLIIDGEPAAIANCCVCEPFAASNNASGWIVEWLPD